MSILQIILLQSNKKMRFVIYYKSFANALKGSISTLAFKNEFLKNMDDLIETLFFKDEKTN